MMPTSLSAPLTVTPAGTTTVVIAPLPDDAARGWRRLVGRVDLNKSSTYALEGQPLVAGGAYAIQLDALVVTQDVYQVDRHIRVLRVRPGGLELLKEWRQKAPLGARAVKAIAKLMPGVPVYRAAPIAGVANRFPGVCYRCGERVSSGAGSMICFGGKDRVVHPDRCPPIPPRRNERDGWCYRCGKPVLAGQGILHRAWDDITSSPRWSVTHTTDADCSAAPLDSPNKWDGWCADCSGLVRAGQGFWSDRAVRHAPGCCGVRPALPLWVITTSHRAHAPGDILRANVRARSGERPVPNGAPGRTVLDTGLVSVIVTVVDVHDRCDGLDMVLVRAATWDEACEILAAEVDLAVDAMPDPRGFKAAWAAERIGPGASSRGRDMRGCAPWLAEIIGHDEQYGLRRVFLQGRRDYTEATNSGSRGIWYRWVLSPDRVYEAYRPLRWGGIGERVFLRATPDGGTEEITREQVEARLRYGLTVADPFPEEG
jgi:hypothetical protein